MTKRRERHARSHPARFHPHEREHARFMRARRLQRQLFFSFGAAIAVTMLTTSSMFVVSVASERPWLRPLGIFFSAAIVWMLSGMVARRIALPLRELSRVAQDLGAGKLESRAALPRRGAAEVRELASSINDMAARLERQVKSQRDLLGSVSHELRTPLARMRVLLAIAQDQATTSPESLAQMEREIVEMDALVGELLAGARVEAGVIERRPLALDELAREAIARAESVSDLKLALQLSPDVSSVQGDATLLGRALSILLDNAKRHGASCATLSIEHAGGVTRFALDDDGPGFAPDDLERVFTPFARGQGKAPDERTGVGLGLYLLKRIAEAHGGTAFAENRSQGGARVGFSMKDT